jgi:hypothetical protein
MVVLLASMVACRPCRGYYSPKILPATAKCKWFKSWNKHQQKEASMEFFLPCQDISNACRQRMVCM